jgi:hypothetical protein
MNTHQIKRQRTDSLTPAVIGILIAVALAVLVGVAVHEAFATVTGALSQAGA